MQDYFECVTAEFFALAKTKATKRQKCLLSDDICHFLRFATAHKVKFEFTSQTRSVRHSRVQQCLLGLMEGDRCRESAEIEPTTHVTLRSCSVGLRLQHSTTLVKIAVYELNSPVERVGLILI